MCSKPIFCSKIALKGKSCSRLLKQQKVAPNAKSCSKVAEHNRDRPKYNYHDSLQAYLIEGIEHFCAVERARLDGVFLSRQMHQNYTIVFFSE